MAEGTRLAQLQDSVKEFNDFHAHQQTVNAQQQTFNIRLEQKLNNFTDLLHTVL